MKQRTVAVIGLKGGVGKTTTAVYLAEAAARRGDGALLVDADPQGSALGWSAEAAEDGSPLDATTVGVTARSGFGAHLERLASPYGAVVIDTPPSDSRDHALVRAAVAAADVVVVPIAPTPLEVERMWPTLALVDETGTPTVLLVVRARRTRSLDAIRRGLADSQWPLLDTTIPLREAIAASYGSRPRKLFGYDEALDELERMN